MPTLWTSFWAVVVFGSIAWYAFLLGYIGIKAGGEILQFTRSRGRADDEAAR